MEQLKVIRETYQELQEKHKANINKIIELYKKHDFSEEYENKMILPQKKECDLSRQTLNNYKKRHNL